MSSMEERYEGDFLEAIDLPEGVLVPVVIDKVTPPDTEKDSGGKTIKKAILTFRDKKKRFVLNKTNYRLLKTLLGSDVSKWAGQGVNLQRRYLDAKHAFGQENEMCVRIIPPNGTPIPKSARDYIGTKHPVTE